MAIFGAQTLDGQFISLNYILAHRIASQPVTGIIHPRKATPDNHITSTKTLFTKKTLP